MDVNEWIHSGAQCLLTFLVGYSGSFEEKFSLIPGKAGVCPPQRDFYVICRGEAWSNLFETGEAFTHQWELDPTQSTLYV